MMLCKLHSIYTKDGVKGLTDKIKSRVYKKAYYYKTNINNITFENELSFKFVPMNKSLLDEIASKHYEEISPKKFEILRSRLDKNSSNKGYIIIDNNNVIYGYYHIAFKENFETCTNYLVPNEPMNIYLFDDYTFINQRGKGAHKFSICSRLLIGMKLGYKSATVSILSGNGYSEHAYTSLGFKKYKSIEHYNFIYFKKNVVKEL